MSTADVVIGSAIGLVGTLGGGWLAISADRRRLARDARVAVYRDWTLAASTAASVTRDAWQAWEDNGEQSPQAVKLRKEAEDAMSAMTPAHINLMLLGVPSRIWEAAEDGMRFMRAVRRHQEDGRRLRSQLEPVFRMMAEDVRRYKSLWSRITQRRQEASALVPTASSS